MCVCRQGIHVQRYVESWMDWCRYQMRYGWEGSRIDVYRSGWYPFPNVYGEKSGGNKKSVLRQKRWPCTSVNCWFDRWVAARTHPNMNTFLFWPNNSFVVIIFVVLFSVCFRSRLVTNCILLCVRACVRASMGPFCCADWKKINRSLWALISYWVLWPRRCHLFGNNPLFSDYSYSFCMAIVVLSVCLSSIPSFRHPVSHSSGYEIGSKSFLSLVLTSTYTYTCLKNHLPFPSNLFALVAVINVIQEAICISNGISEYQINFLLSSRWGPTNCSSHFQGGLNISNVLMIPMMIRWLSGLCGVSTRYVYVTCIC